MRNEWSIDLADCIPVHAREEWVRFDMLYGKAILLRREESADEILCILTQMNVIGKRKMVPPIDDFLVCVVSVFGAEWRVANQRFEHDRTERPPITLFTVAVHLENLWCDVVRCPHSGICKLSPIRFPSGNLLTTCHSKVDGVDHNAISGGTLRSSGG